MHQTHRWLRALCSACLVALALPPAYGQGNANKSDAHVKITAKAAKPDADGTQLVTLTLAINKPWHAYANPVGNDDLADAATTVKAVKGTLVKVEYPAGIDIKDATIGNYKVYEGTAAIKVHVKRAANTEPIELEVKFQVCDDKKCLPPAKVKVPVP